MPRYLYLLNSDNQSLVSTDQNYQNQNKVFGSVNDKKTISSSEPPVEPEPSVEPTTTSTPVSSPSEIPKTPIPTPIQSPTVEKDSKPATVSEAIKTVKVNAENDLVILLIDVSSSMKDDVDEISKNLEEIITQYNDKSFMVIGYTYSPKIIGEASKDKTSLEQSLQNCGNLIRINMSSNDKSVGIENSLTALDFSVQNSTDFKSPIIFLITDAAPNDKNSVDANLIIEKLNSANVSLYILEANDADGDEAKNGGAALGNETYNYIINKMKRKSGIKVLK